MSHQIRPPKNRRYYIAMVIGAPNTVYLELKEKLRKWKTVVKYHHDKDPNDMNIPLDVDYVYSVTDLCNHGKWNHARDLCKQKDIIFIAGSKQIAHAAAQLSRHFPRTEITQMEADSEAKVVHDDKWYEQPIEEDPPESDEPVFEAVDNDERMMRELEEAMADKQLMVASNGPVVDRSEPVDFDIDADAESDLMRALAKIRNSLRLSPEVNLKILVTSSSYKIEFVKGD